VSCDSRQVLRRGGCGTVWAALPGRREVIKQCASRRICERSAVVGKSPVGESVLSSWYGIPSSTEPVEFRVNRAGPPAKPEYSLVTDSGPVP
jgi:hypothetical protein